MPSAIQFFQMGDFGRTQSQPHDPLNGLDPEVFRRHIRRCPDAVRTQQEAAGSDKRDGQINHFVVVLSVHQVLQTETKEFKSSLEGSEFQFGDARDRDAVESGVDKVHRKQLRLFDEEFATHHLRSAGWEFQHMLDSLADAIGRPLTPADVEPYSWALASVGASLTDATYSASQTWQRAYTAEVSAWWANDFDLLLTPAAGQPPALLEELLPPPADPLSILPRSSTTTSTSSRA